MENYQNPVNQMPTPGGMRAVQMGTLAQSASTRNPDTMSNRLEQIASALHDAEVQLSHMRQKIHGPEPEKEKVLEQPNGISAWTMDINARAQRLRDGLAELSNFLG